MFKIGQIVKDKNTGKSYTIKRVNKNGTVRVTFWDRWERLVECTCRAEEIMA
jgi:uncharacterized protein YodC (DUF2158 family)